MIGAVSAAVVCLAAAILDIKTEKIPNKLTFTAIIIGLIMTALLKPFTSLAASVFFIAALFFLGMSSFIGLGDIKLLMTITALGGCKMCVISFIVGVLCLCACASIFNPIETYIYIQKMLQRLRFKRQKINKESTKYKFAPFLFLGTIFFIILNR